MWRGAGAEDRTRIRGRTSSLSSVVAVVDFTASEGAALLSSRTIVVSLPFLLHVLSPLPPSSPFSLSAVTGPQSVVHCLVNAGTLTQLTQRSAITLIRRLRDAL